MKIGLALNGAGTLGIAHAGVLEVLEAYQVPIHRVCGTSSGALIGMLYCAGGLPLLDRVLLDLERQGIINTPGGLFFSFTRSFNTVRKTLRRYITARSLADLPIPCSCVASDLLSGEIIRLQEADPVAAVMASNAYPGVFPAQRLGPYVLVDGGVTRNFPADVLRGDPDLDFIIGSSVRFLLTLPQQQQERFGRLHTMIRAVEVMVQASNNIQLPQCDFCFEPPAEHYRIYDTAHLHAVRRLGKMHAEQHIGQLLTLLEERQAR